MNLIKIYSDRTKDWEQQVTKDEWFFCKLREEITSSLEPHEAFEVIPQAVKLIRSQKEYTYLCYECIQLLISLANRTGTTEIPSELSKDWNGIMTLIESFGDDAKKQANELRRYYRK
jgi:hypothetical protein